MFGSFYLAYSFITQNVLYRKFSANKYNRAHTIKFFSVS